MLPASTLPEASARGLHLGPAVDERNRLGHLLVRHIVKHDDVGSGFERLAHLVLVLALDLARADERRVRAGARHRSGDTACSVDMIVLAIPPAASI